MGFQFDLFNSYDPQTYNRNLNTAMSMNIKNFYNSNPLAEWERLACPYQSVEFVSTLFLIEKYFPKTGHVFDIGCGPGRYSIDLLKKGYEVSLLDLSDKLLEQAQERLHAADLAPNAIYCLDARNLSEFADATFDSSLLLGPLYHLVHKEDRINVLSNLKRILKKGGIALAAYINTWGVLKCGLSDFPERFGNYDYLNFMLKEKFYDNSSQGGFTESYWSTPEIAFEEIESVGFEVVSYAGSEGFISGMMPMIKEISQTKPKVYKNLIRFAAENCELPQYRDATEHITFVIRNPD